MCEGRSGGQECALGPGDRWDTGTCFLTSFLSLWFPDAISATNPRVIDDSRARKLSNDLKRCTYYETCATYGLNVERVFQDGNCRRWRVSVWDRQQCCPREGAYTAWTAGSVSAACCWEAKAVRHAFLCSAAVLHTQSGSKE